MRIGYSPETLWNNIKKQREEMSSETQWLNLYISTKEVECVEDCVRNIMDSCTGILENIENLKGEEM